MTAPLPRVHIARTANGRSAFAVQASRQGAKALARELEAVGLDAVERCDDIVRAEMDTSRPASRRKPGRHLLGSFRHEVVWDGVDFPVSIRLYSLADPGKVNALEFGADPHPIDARNSVWMTFPDSRGPSFGVAKVKHVEHPGNLPYSMMGRALQSAIRARLRRSVKLVTT